MIDFLQILSLIIFTIEIDLFLIELCCRRISLRLIVYYILIEINDYFKKLILLFLFRNQVNALSYIHSLF